MKEFNINRLMKSCPWINQISDETFDALSEYYEGLESINEINVDNDIINSLTELTLEELNEQYDNIEDLNYLLQDKENNIYTIWN
tara:strand:+ start:339 stop:593 length:255 start_codon:yes stop_codon:yes gene_type:complete